MARALFAVRASVAPCAVAAGALGFACDERAAAGTKIQRALALAPVHDAVTPGCGQESDLHAGVLVGLAPRVPQIRVATLAVDVEAHADGVVGVEVPRDIGIELLPAAVRPLVVVRERDVLIVALDDEAVVATLPVLDGPGVDAVVTALAHDEAVAFDRQCAIRRVEIDAIEAVVAPAKAARVRLAAARPDLRVGPDVPHLQARVPAALVPGVPEVRVAAGVLRVHADTHSVTDLERPVHVQALLVPAAFGVAVVVRDGDVLVVALDDEAVVATLAVLVHPRVDAVVAALEDVDAVVLYGELGLRRVEVDSVEAVRAPAAAARVLAAAARPHGRRAEPVHLHAAVLARGTPRVPEVGVSALLVSVVPHAHGVAHRELPGHVAANLVPAALVPVEVLAHGDVLVVLLQRDAVLATLPVLDRPRINAVETRLQHAQPVPVNHLQRAARRVEVGAVQAVRRPLSRAQVLAAPTRPHLEVAQRRSRAQQGGHERKAKA
jgi:hypothetical protein